MFDDSSHVTKCWYDIFNCIVDEHLPLKQKRVKRKVPKWFTNEITQAIKSRDRLLKVAKKSNLSTDWAGFKKAKNEVTKLIRKSKETYFKSKVAENRHNPCKLWHLIKGGKRETMMKEYSA